MPLNNYARNRIVMMRTNLNLSTVAIKEKLAIEDKIKCSRQSIVKLLAKHEETGSTTDRPRSGRPQKYDRLELFRIIDMNMEQNDEMTARELQKRLQDEGYILSIPAVKKLR
jgi:transposase